MVLYVCILFIILKSCSWYISYSVNMHYIFIFLFLCVYICVYFIIIIITTLESMLYFCDLKKNTWLIFFSNLLICYCCNRNI